MEPTIPIACTPFALTAPERTRSRALRATLGQRTVIVQESSGGYSFRYNGGADSFRLAAEWIELERRCCPFLSFSLRWSAGEEAPVLEVIGPDGTKDFMAAEMPELPRE